MAAAVHSDRNEANAKLFYNNLKFLGWNNPKIILNERSFLLGNTAAFNEVSHWLLRKLDEKKTKEVFRDCWPINNDKRQEAAYRKVLANFLQDISKDKQSGLSSLITASMLHFPFGAKFFNIFLPLSSYVMLKTIKPLGAIIRRLELHPNGEIANQQISTLLGHSEVQQENIDRASKERYDRSEIEQYIQGQMKYRKELLMKNKKKMEKASTLEKITEDAGVDVSNRGLHIESLKAWLMNIEGIAEMQQRLRKFDENTLEETERLQYLESILGETQPKPSVDVKGMGALEDCSSNNLLDLEKLLDRGASVVEESTPELQRVQLVDYEGGLELMRQQLESVETIETNISFFRNIESEMLMELRKGVDIEPKRSTRDFGIAFDWQKGSDVTPTEVILEGEDEKPVQNGIFQDATENTPSREYSFDFLSDQEDQSVSKSSFVTPKSKIGGIVRGELGLAPGSTADYCTASLPKITSHSESTFNDSGFIKKAPGPDEFDLMSIFTPVTEKRSLLLDSEASMTSALPSLTKITTETPSVDSEVTEVTKTPLMSDLKASRTSLFDSEPAKISFFNSEATKTSLTSEVFKVPAAVPSQKGSVATAPPRRESIVKLMNRLQKVKSSIKERQEEEEAEDDSINSLAEKSTLDVKGLTFQLDLDDSL